ncbi:hypothetical protein [Bosea sp. AS-1]|jgi:hypothetical protein|uniref:hypothetical protein n=1 Tax=Bosea sp. AS-1 TaxID=2015316 RepID=UPI000B798447|nr:hypothetical protein [Bosea sp. AS-1]
MIAALFLFGLGIVLGRIAVPILSIAIPILLTIVIVAVWLVTGELSFLSFLILVGYLLAFHAGYLLGTYLWHRRSGRSPAPASVDAASEDSAPKADGRGSGQLH